VRRRALLASLPWWVGVAAAQPLTQGATVPACFDRQICFGASNTVPPGATLDLSFMGGTLDPRIAFSRAAGPATYFDATGTMRTAGVNLLFPSVPDTTAWTSGAATVTLGASAAPDGTVTATRVAETTASALHYVVRSPVATTSLGPQTLSLYAKAAGTRYLQVSLDDSGSGTIGGYATFDLQAGVVSGALTARGAAVIGTAVIQAAGNGFYRCSITVTTTGAALNDRAFLILSNVPAPAFSPTYAGNAANGLLVWGVQLEVGSSASPYIPTTSAASGAPRFDYDPVARSLRGLLIEEARTNILFPSQTISSWPLKTDTVVTDNSAISPDGTTNASLATEGVAGTATVGASGFTVAASSTVTYSIFLKRGNTDWVRIIAADNGSTNGITVWVNLATGASSFAARGTATAQSASVTTLGNGWYRMIATCTLAGTSTSAALSTLSSTGNGQTTRVNNATYYAWGAQVELGAFPTSYIPTTSAAVTRAADQASMPIGAWYNPNAGSIVAEFSARNIPPAGRQAGIVRIDDATSANRAQIYLNPATGNVFAFGSVAGVTQANPNGQVITGAPQKAALTYGSPWTFAFDGVAGASAGTTTPLPVTRMLIGEASATLGQWPLNGWLRRIRYWPRALTSTELQQVTT
jgi:hypothetical protein